jgi:hypothetical protein
MKWIIAAGLTAALAAAAMAAPPDGDRADIDPAVRSVLTQSLPFSASELAGLQHDRIVKHNLDSKWPREFGVAGAVRIRADKAAFIAAARDIVRFKADPSVLQIGRLSDPPTVEDLAGLTVDKDDFDAPSCRVHDCGIRLPADVIERIPREIDLTAPDVQARAAAWFKRVLVADVAAYMSGGAGRFAQYDDDPAPVRPLDDFEAVLAHTPAISALAPGLSEHLLAFPARRVSGADDFFYWSKEKFGVAPFISVTQVTIVCPSDRTCIMTTKDIYSSRYIDASLALAVATDAGRGGGFVLVYANRSRASALNGRLSGVRRSIVERRSRSAIEDSLKTIKNRLEKPR